MSDVKYEKHKIGPSCFERDLICRFHEGPPFARPTSGHLVHRVRSVTMFNCLSYPHASIDFWCGSTGSISNHNRGRNSDMFDVPPNDALVCSRCEAVIEKKGLVSSSELTGRHVHIGHMRPVRECCNESEG